MGSRWLRGAMLLVLPVVLLFPFADIGLVSDDLHCVRTDFPLDIARILRGDDWTHEPVPGARAWRPVTIASYALTHAAAGDSPAAYRVSNFVLHGAVCALLADLAFVLSGSAVAAWVAGLLFAVHPVHHENILWVAGRTGLLSASFALIVLRFGIPVAGRASGRSSAVMAVGTALAFASYEAAIVLPLVVLGVAFFLRREERAAGRLLAAAVALPSASVVLVLGLLRWFLVAAPRGDVGAFGAPRFGRNAAGLLARCLAIPRGPGGPIVADPVFLFGVVVSGILLFAALRFPAARRTLAVSAVLFAVAFLPFLPLAGYSDRFAYLSSAGAVLALAAGAAAGAASRFRIPVLLLVGILAVAWGGRLLESARQWRRGGEITENVERVLKNDPAAAVASRLDFFCIPDFHGGVPVYVTYFDRHVADSLGGRAVAIRRYRDDGHETLGGVAASLVPGQVAYRWNPTTWNLDRIDAGLAGSDEPVCRPFEDPIRP